MAKNESQEIKRNGLLTGLSFTAPVIQQTEAAGESRGGEKDVTTSQKAQDAPQMPAASTEGNNTTEPVEPSREAPEVPDAIIESEDELPVVKAVEDGYRRQFAAKRSRETLSHRTTISLAPSVKAKVDEAVERGTIKSLNDLVNYLLRQYFGC